MFNLKTWMQYAKGTPLTSIKNEVGSFPEYYLNEEYKWHRTNVWIGNILHFKKLFFTDSNIYRKIMYRRMNRLFLAPFLSFPLMGYSSGLFCPYSGHIEDTNSVEFVSVLILGWPPFWLKRVGLLNVNLFSCLFQPLLIWFSCKTVNLKVQNVIVPTWY